MTVFPTFDWDWQNSSFIETWKVSICMTLCFAFPLNLRTVRKLQWLREPHPSSVAVQPPQNEPFLLVSRSPSNTTVTLLLAPSPFFNAFFELFDTCKFCHVLTFITLLLLLIINGPSSFVKSISPSEYYFWSLLY